MCMYVFMYAQKLLQDSSGVYVCMCVYVCMYACMHARIYVCICMTFRRLTNAYAYTCDAFFLFLFFDVYLVASGRRGERHMKAYKRKHMLYFLFSFFLFYLGASGRRGERH